MVPYTSLSHEGTSYFLHIRITGVAADDGFVLGRGGVFAEALLMLLYDRDSLVDYGDLLCMKAPDT